MIEFINEMYAWVTHGIYDFVIEVYAWIVIKISIFQIKASIASMQFAWDVSKEIFTQLNISGEMQSVLNSLPADLVNKLNFFNVINGINLLINAVITRFVMRFF